MEKMLSVNPERLLFSRRYYGYSLDFIARQTSLKMHDIQDWEDGKDSPSYAQLEKLATIYNQSLLFFFLQGDLPENRLEGAFRSADNKLGSDQSKKAKDMLEKANIFRINLAELYENESFSTFVKLVETENVQKGNIAGWLRDKLDFPIVKQTMEFNRADKLLEHLRAKLYDIGIYTFKDSFRDNEICGLCLFDEFYPVIILNNKTTFNRQVFTLFHEIYHIYIKETDINWADESTESECNIFASEFLIPDIDLSEQLKNYSSFENDSTISALAARYVVSKDAIMYRLCARGLISPGYYSNEHNAIIRNVKQDSAGGNFYFTKISYLGRRYLDRVFSQYYSGKISSSQVGMYTEIRASNVAKLATNTFGGSF